jgi:hypothetical protein
MSRATETDERPALVDRLGRWWRTWSRRRRRLAELDCCGPAEVEHIARDLGISRAELSVLAGKWPEPADLLSRRLEQVNLDRAELARVEPQVLRDLERVCTLCGSKRKCEYDLVAHPSRSAWTKYCPNATTLGALIAERLRGASRGGLECRENIPSGADGRHWC